MTLRVGLGSCSARCGCYKLRRGLCDCTIVSTANRHRKKLAFFPAYAEATKDSRENRHLGEAYIYSSAVKERRCDAVHKYSEPILMFELCQELTAVQMIVRSNCIDTVFACCLTRLC